MNSPDNSAGGSSPWAFSLPSVLPDASEYDLPDLDSVDQDSTFSENRQGFATNSLNFGQIAVITVLFKAKKSKLYKAQGGVVKKKDGKFCSEIRIAKEILINESYSKSNKVWLGTFRFASQAVRALDVGKVFFSKKKRKNYHDPEIAVKLSHLSDNLTAKTIKEKVESVKALAKQYGEKKIIPLRLEKGRCARTRL